MKDREWLIISKRDRLEPKNPGTAGHLYHYGHFIMDFALPFLKYYLELMAEKDSNEPITFYLPPNSHFGTMKKIFFAIYPGIKIHEIKTDINPHSDNRLVVQGYCRSQFHTELKSETDAFHQFIVEKALQTLNGETRKWPKVLLIQRGQEQIYKNHANGASRRSIYNHKVLVDELKTVFQDDFQNIVLEGMDFWTQVLYFYHARLVVGQYGSGLVNILWMQPGGTCIGLSNGNLDKKDPVFIKCCKARGVDYKGIHCKSLRQNSTQWVVPINEFKTIIEAILQNCQ